MNLPFRILSGTRLELLLAGVVLLSIYYSADARDLLRRIPFLRSSIEAKDRKRFVEMKELHGDAYSLLLAIVGRVTGDVIRWSLVSLGVLVLYNVASFLQMEILDDRRVTMIALAAVLGAPLFGLLTSILWIRKLIAELSEFDKVLKGVREESAPSAL